MKILFLNFWASKPGGAEISLVDLISEVSRKHQTRLITSESGYLTENAAFSGCKCSIIRCNMDLTPFQRNHLFLHCLSHVAILFKFIKYCFAVKQEVFSDMPDIIHANVPKSHMILHFLLAAGFKGKAVFHIREIFNRHSTVSILYSLLFRFHPAPVIAISHAVFYSLPRPMKKTSTVIYNGVEIPVSVPSRNFTHKEPAFLYLGRVVPWKGCDLLIEAFNLLVKKYSEKSGTLSIIGGSFYWNRSYRESLQDKIRLLGLEKNIALLEHSDNPGILFNQHSVLCVPSDREPFGRVAAEAMAWGLPVIGFNFGGLSEVVKHSETGLLGQERTAEVLCSLMEYSIVHPDELARMGAKGRERCKQFFDKNKQIPQIARAIIN
jgi:glycosyltransferase involved in cell wall biosynthesis